MGLVKRDWLIGRPALKGCCWKWRIASGRGRVETKYNVTRATQRSVGEKICWLDRRLSCGEIVVAGSCPSLSGTLCMCTTRSRLGKGKCRRLKNLFAPPERKRSGKRSEGSGSENPSGRFHVLSVVGIQFCAAVTANYGTGLP
jgi:hypothetical protein